MAKIRVLLFLFLLAGCAAQVQAGEKPFSWTPAPAQGFNIAVNIGSYSLGKYLTECQVNRPEILNEVKALLQEGKYYRKRTKDQKARGTLLTVYVDNSYMLHIVTFRNETCPDCKGSGKRAAPFGSLSSHVEVQFGCLKCNGKGYLENQVTERYFMLSPEDFENPEEGRRIMGQRAYAEAPQGTQAWVDRLASAKPQERLEACLWLDENYVRVGEFFQDIMPMLKKARYYDANEKKKIMVWQFWAGKNMPEENNRAYYRIYADSQTGKITKKGFFSGR